MLDERFNIYCTAAALTEAVHVYNEYKQAVNTGDVALVVMVEQGWPPGWVLRCASR